jgi:hypothetical protein
MRYINVIIEPYAFELSERNHYQIDNYKVMLHNMSTNKNINYLFTVIQLAERRAWWRGAMAEGGLQWWPANKVREKLYRGKESEAEGILVINQNCVLSILKLFVYKIMAKLKKIVCNGIYLNFNF